MRRFTRPVALVALLSTAVLPTPATAQARAPDGAETNVTRLRDAIVFDGEPGRALLAATRQTQPDSVGDGITYGALIGAGFAVGMMAVMYARCDAGCEAPAEGPTFLMAGASGAGIGALVGWIIDASRKGPDRRVSVTPVVTARRRAVVLTLNF